MKVILKILIPLIVILVLIILYVEVSSGRTKAIKNSRGEIIPESVALLEKVELGGMEQWILIRGQNTNNPVLYW